MCLLSVFSIINQPSWVPKDILAIRVLALSSNSKCFSQLKYVRDQCPCLGKYIKYLLLALIALEATIRIGIMIIALLWVSR